MAYGRARGPLWEEIRPYMSPLQGPTPHTQAVVICWVANNLHQFHDIFFLIPDLTMFPSPTFVSLLHHFLALVGNCHLEARGTLVNPQSGNTELGANFPSQFGASFVISPFWNIQKHVLTLTSGIKGWLTHTHELALVSVMRRMSRNNTHSQRGGSVSQACQRRPLKGRHVNIYGHVNEQSKGVEHTNIWVLGEQQSCESYNFAILMVEGGGQYVWGNINGVSVVYV